MKPVQIHPDAGTADPVLAVGLLDAIGADDFAHRVLNAVNGPLPVSHCTVFALHGTGRVEDVSSASAIGEVATVTAHEYTRLGFDRKDSNMQWLARRKAGKSRQSWLSHQFAHEVADELYRRVCYGETGIRERLSLLSVYPDGYRVAVNFYRNHAYPEYTPPDMAWIAAQGTLIAAAVMRHAQLRRAPLSRASAAPGLLSQLSAREREVISHILVGLTTKEAARVMGLSLTTALTYRQRAFQHVGVRTHRELLALLSKRVVNPS